MPQAPQLEVFVVAAGEGVTGKVFEVLRLLRKAGIAADRDYLGRGLKGQLKQAHRRGVQRVIILGEEELQRGNVAVRAMDTGEQVEVAETELIAWLKMQRA
uniref:Anticodon-binding domain-containing protein n=1 Tax=Ammonifex degensii TaxID=42838 RepID=A0A7C2I1Q4_9THEO